MSEPRSIQISKRNNMSNTKNMAIFSPTGLWPMCAVTQLPGCFPNMPHTYLIEIEPIAGAIGFDWPRRHFSRPCTLPRANNKAGGNRPPHFGAGRRYCCRQRLTR